MIRHYFSSPECFHNCMLYLAALLSGLLVALPYLYPNTYFLMWVAFVPLLWAVQNVSWGKAYRLSIVSGLLMYGVASSFTVDFIETFNGASHYTSVLTAAIFWIYCAQVPALAIVVTRCLSFYTQLPWILLFPLCISFFFSQYPMIMPIQLGESQSRFLLAIQATDLVGVAGLDFVIAVSNMLFFTGLNVLLKQKAEIHRAGYIVIASGIVIVWFSYGIVTKSYWDQRISSWDVRSVGIVQSNEIPSARLPDPVPGYSRAYPPEMPLTERLVDLGAEVVIWPETRYKGYFSFPHIEAAFRQHVAALGVPLIFQDTEERKKQRSDPVYNSVVQLNRDGELQGVYRKIERMPFSEYVPFLQYSPLVKQWFYHRFSDFFADFSQGKAPAVFSVSGMRLVPLICYEAILSEFSAQSIGRDGQGKVIVVVSNSGWFGFSNEAYQQLNASILRSVENRVPLLQVINNGPSGLVLPNGELVAITEFQTRLGAIFRVPYSESEGGSFFSRHPFLFLNVVSFMLLFAVIISLFRVFKFTGFVERIKV